MTPHALKNCKHYGYMYGNYEQKLQDPKDPKVEI